MKKIIFSLSLLLAGCTQIIDNPYSGMSSSQLSTISSKKLCNTVNNHHIKSSDNVLNELQSRGYRDCSDSEIFC